jgi:two-component system sensor histidine kinase DegS
LQSRYATRSSIDAGLFLLVAAILLAAGLAVFVITSERHRHEEVESVNARLLKEVTEREAERSRLAERIITAEQDERRRLALFLHDGPVQNLSGIALMLDAAVYAIDEGRPDDARGIMASALEKHRDTIRSLRDLSFNIEPVVLRDQGFAPAVRELADQLGMEHSLQIDLDVERAERLAESVQVGLYQIIRESLHQAVRRGPPTRISVVVQDVEDGGVEAVISDDGKGERRRATLDAIEQRASTLNARFSIDHGEDGGTSIRVVLPAYATDPEPSAQH